MNSSTPAKSFLSSIWANITAPAPVTPIQAFMNRHPQGTYINYLGVKMLIAAWYSEYYRNDGGLFDGYTVPGYIVLQYVDAQGVLREHHVKESQYDIFIAVAQPL